ncbi:hypothetical protein CH375_03605 [Leptospira ellisii]|uniref:Uncharacterized protein n=1 Tax=Leptospira ellisii TaxID=2023197 RepID=A0A2N0BNY7_9LEPT|nr:hypothetical protein CH379_14390 [Leptospira ellisii]PKA05716.1 hypothetical protein CH375_03605 [Leptospira ellisii]
MVPLEILRPVYNPADNTLDEEASEHLIVYAESWKPKTRIRNSDHGIEYTSLHADILPDQDIRPTDLVKWPQGLTREDFEFRGKYLSILYYYLALDANQNAHHIEIEV